MMKGGKSAESSAGTFAQMRAKARQGRLAGKRYPKDEFGKGPMPRDVTPKRVVSAAEVRARAMGLNNKKPMKTPRTGHDPMVYQNGEKKKPPQFM
jgi:hypothetical protein